MKKLLFVIALLVFSGCDDQPPIKTVEGVRGKIKSHTDFGYYGDLYTLEHDGHKFVIWDDIDNGGLVHHPDCPACK